MSDDRWVHVPELDGHSHLRSTVHAYAYQYLPYVVRKVPRGISRFIDRREWLYTIGPKLLRNPENGYWERNLDGCWYFAAENGYCFLRERDAFEFKMRFG